MTHFETSGIMMSVTDWSTVNCFLDPPLWGQIHLAPAETNTQAERGSAGKAYLLCKYYILQILLGIFHTSKTKILKMYIIYI